MSRRARTAAWLRGLVAAAGLVAALGAAAATVRLWPPHQDVAVGDPVSFVVYVDFAGDPTLGGGVDVSAAGGILGYTGFEFDPGFPDDPDLRRMPNLRPGELNGLAFGHVDGIDGVHAVGVLTLRAASPGSTELVLTANDVPAGGFVSATTLAPQSVGFEGATVRVFAGIPVLPRPTVTANGASGNVSVPIGSAVQVAVSLDPGDLAGEAVDWWVSAETPFGDHWWTPFTGWVRSDAPLRALGGPLSAVGPVDIVAASDLAPGSYSFRFAVDHDLDREVDDTYSSRVDVNVFAPLGEWSLRTPMPSPRFEAGVALLDGNIYVLGGIVDATGASENTFVRYDIATDAWTLLPPLPSPAPLNHVALAAVDGRLLAVGGFEAGFVPVATVFSFDPVSATWSPRASLPEARGSIGVAVVGGLVYAIGGAPDPLGSRATVYDPAADRWSDLPPMPTARDSLATAVVDDRIYAISGRTQSLELRPEVEVFDVVSRQWSDAAPIPTPRGGHAAAATGGRLYVFGGEGNEAPGSNGVFSVVEEYDPAADAWRPVSLMPDGGRHGFGAVAHKGRIWLPGGAPVIGFGRSDRLDVYLPPVTPVGPLAYITNFDSDDVSVIDTATDFVTGAIAVGDGPRGVALQPDGTRAYATNAFSSSLSVIDVASGSVIDSIPVGTGPNGASGVALSPDGTTAYVGNLDGGMLHIVDIATGSVTGSVPVGAAPRGVAVHPGGGVVYVANSDDDTLSVVAADGSGVVTTVPVGDFPFGVAVHPDGSRVYVANDGDGSLSVIDTADHSVAATVPVAGYARGVAVHPDGGTVYVTTFVDSTMVVIDTASLQTVATVPVGPGPVGVSVHPDGTRVYTANFGDDTVTVVDTLSNTVREILHVHSTPVALGRFIQGSGPAAP